MADSNYNYVKNAVLNRISEGWIDTEHDALMFINSYYPKFTLGDFVTLLNELRRDGKLC